MWKQPPGLRSGHRRSKRADPRGSRQKSNHIASGTTAGMVTIIKDRVRCSRTDTGTKIEELREMIETISVHSGKEMDSMK